MRRSLLVCVVVLGVPAVSMLPLIYARAQKAAEARRAVPQQAAHAAPSPAAPDRCSLAAGPDGEASPPDELAGPGDAAPPPLPAPPPASRFVLPAAVCAAVAAAFWQRRRRALLRYHGVPSDAAAFWKAAQDRRRLGEEPVFAWLPWAVRVALVGEALPQMAFSALALAGLALAPLPFDAVLMVALVQGAAFALFVHADGTMRRRVGTRVVRALALALTPRAVALADLEGLPEGRLVRVRGRVRARRLVPGLVDGRPAVGRLTLLVVEDERFTSFGVRPVEYALTDEALEDFDVVDDEGHGLRVEAQRARILASAPPLRWMSSAVLVRLPGVAFSRAAKARASEIRLDEHDEVEVVGWKEAVLDPTGERSPRETPVRLALRSDARRPLLVMPRR